MILALSKINKKYPHTKNRFKLFETIDNFRILVFKIMRL